MLREMIIRMLLGCGLLGSLLAAAPLRAQLRVIPQSVLDSLNNPPTVSGSDVVRFERTAVDAGTLREEDAPSEYTFRWSNMGAKTLVITRVTTTCSCTTVTYDKQPVTAGGTGSVTVTYHPKGHPGSFSRRIFVYTQLSDKQPSAVLTLSGTVEPSALSAAGFTATMGALQVSRRTVRFDGTTGKLQQANIACCNAGTTALRIGYDRNLLPGEFSLECIPAELQAGEEGTLVIRYQPGQQAASKPGEFPLLLQGLNVPPSQRTIRILLDNE